MSKSIWDVRFSNVRQGYAQDDWITMHGAHVLVDDKGVIVEGADGKFNGQKVQELKRRLRPSGPPSKHEMKHITKQGHKVQGRYQMLKKKDEELKATLKKEFPEGSYSVKSEKDCKRFFDLHDADFEQAKQDKRDIEKEYMKKGWLDKDERIKWSELAEALDFAYQDMYMDFYLNNSRDNTINWNGDKFPWGKAGDRNAIKNAFKYGFANVHDTYKVH